MGVDLAALIPLTSVNTCTASAAPHSAARAKKARHGASDGLPLRGLAPVAIIPFGTAGEARAVQEAYTPKARLALAPLATVPPQCTRPTSHEFRAPSAQQENTARASLGAASAAATRSGSAPTSDFSSGDFLLTASRKPPTAVDGN
ncbi:hypothetical protein OHT20_04660 [Streptomyces caniferus]|uniref:hypothetical protein n=1 Tax=Streptomyces caniferus TaxID=285557 RepID=UPI002E2C641B|nr:hypothetical protein [Streptomyces caniferus]